jgi:hypothetical protein
MSEFQPARKGPWLHRFLVHLFTVILAVLVYWLLGFVVDDIGSWPGPQYTEVEQRLLPTPLVEQSQQLTDQIGDVEQQMRDQRARQEILAVSTASSQKTMNQLLEMQKLALQNKLQPSSEESKALAESEELFLANQKQNQSLNDDLTRLNGQLQTLQQQRRELDKTLQFEHANVSHEFDRLLQHHQLKMAGIKLAALTPLLIVGLFLFQKQRTSLYAPLIYAFGIALLLKVSLVVHEYFPSRYFKYILIAICLAIVVRILVYLLKMIAFPKRDWLLKQYREAYEAFFCPICEYPIRRGPMKYLFWSRRSIRKLLIPAGSPTTPEEPYTCPMCGTRLFEECTDCHTIRHSLLPACQKCGAEKAVS